MPRAFFIWIWVGAIVVSLYPSPVEASLVRCARSVRQAIYAWRIGISSRVAHQTAPQEHPVELEELEPDFQFVRTPLSVYLLEKHSQVRLYFVGGVITASVPAGDPQKNEFITESDFQLSGDDYELLKTLFDSLDLNALSAASRKRLIDFFYVRLFNQLFHEAYTDLFKLGDMNDEPQFKLNGSSVWFQREELVNRGFYGFQVEGWLNKDGELLLNRPLSIGGYRWALLRMVIGKGLIEIRALSTETTELGYHFIRVPLGRFLQLGGRFNQNIERFAFSHYDEALATGQLVNGDHFPFNHLHITRAMEIGLDPQKGYRELSYANRSVMMVQGMFSGKRAYVVSEGPAAISPSGGVRRELQLRIEGHPLSVAMFTSFVMPVADEAMQVGLDPISRRPLEFEVNEEAVDRESGERVRVVVQEGKDRGPVKNYQVVFVTGPRTDQKEIRSTCGLIPLRFLPLSLEATRSPGPSTSDPASPRSEPTR